MLPLTLLLYENRALHPHEVPHRNVKRHRRAGGTVVKEMRVMKGLDTLLYDDKLKMEHSLEYRDESC